MSFTWKRPEGRLMSPEDMMRVIIRVADELDMPDRRGACVIAGMTVRQESDFWRPGNNADPAFEADPRRFPHDSMSDDGKSVGPYQQQTSGPPPAPQWGWGGLYGDPEGTRKRMDPYESTKLFLTALKKEPYRAGNAREANDWAQRVQKSGVPDAYAKHWDAINDLYNRVSGGAPAPAPAPAPAVEPYGLPTGSDSGGYGGGGVRFPDWVYRLGDVFGVKPSTYPGHQETDRIEAGYARNPQHLNRAIDWAGSVDDMTRFADYLATIPQFLEQVIWQNPNTGRSIEVAGGRHQPGYFRDDLAGHRDHVHTRQSRSIPLPGGAVPAPAPVDRMRPDFNEYPKWSPSSSARGGATVDLFLLHTQEGDGDADSLARYLGNPANQVSYHYTVSEDYNDHGVTVVDVVDTDRYSWSVLSANRRSINLCFAGSKVAWSRDEWLRQSRAIDVAAYLAVRDCKKYGIATRVLAPPYNSNPPGISDHKYVTQWLKDGTHTDVGPNFPWDVFTAAVNKYANPPTTPPPTPGDDMALVPQDQWDRVYRELTQRLPSRSPLRHLGEGTVDTLAGFVLNIDSSEHAEIVRLLASLGHPPSLALLREVANADPSKYPDRQSDRLIAQAILADITSTPAPVTAAAATPAEPTFVDARALSDAYAENARLRDENARLQAAATTHAAELIPFESTNGTKSMGDVVKTVVDAVEQLKLADALTIQDRATLAASIKILEMKNGSQI